MKILSVVGARPNFVKVAPLIKEMQRYPQMHSALVHTGQHYDTSMSEQFFAELEISPPDFNLGVGSGTHAVQTAEVMRRLEPILEKEWPDLVLVMGDVNSTLAAALTAVKLGIPVAHVEAGLRSFDRTMPEEINRILTDAIADLLFVTEESGWQNLLREGIEPGKIDKIFNAFEQGQSSITRRFGGLGLGLAISQAMVDAHRGKIYVESPGKNKGATFSIRLNTVPAPVDEIDTGRPEPGRLHEGAPHGDGATQSKPVAVENERMPTSQRRLLVVDDHQDTCTGMKLMLERRGYEITLAHSAEQAVEKARSQKFDLLISDIGLPDRSGYELMRELRHSKGLRGIALSGFGMEHDVNKARAAGFSEHLTKPINFERLEEAIQNLLT